jgi:hypothetical protein
MNSGAAAKSIKTYLARHRFDIVAASDGDDIDPALDAIAFLLAFNFSTFRDLLLHMRGRVREKPGFFHSLEAASHSHRRAVKDLCFLLLKNRLLADCHYDVNSHKVSGAVTLDDRAIRFLTGGWLERCLRVQVASYLNLEPDRVEALSNVRVIRPDRREFEMDMLLAVDGTLYWWEAKSGGFDETHLQRYRGVAAELKLARPQCFLVAAQTLEGQDPLAVGKRIGFNVIGPQHISARIEEIEERHRKTRVPRVG